MNRPGYENGQGGGSIPKDTDGVGQKNEFRDALRTIFNSEARLEVSDTLEADTLELVIDIQSCVSHSLIPRPMRTVKEFMVTELRFYDRLRSDKYRFFIESKNDCDLVEIESCDNDPDRCGFYIVTGDTGEVISARPGHTIVVTTLKCV